MEDEPVTREWPTRPLLTGTVAAIGGLAFNLLTDAKFDETLSVTRQAGATFVAVATLAFVLTIEVKRWTWAVAFAIGWGAVLAFVGWFTASYNVHPSIFEWPFLSGLFAVLLAAPLFQAARDEGMWRFPYAALHRHAWTDAVGGAAALAFTGITFMLAWLIANLFGLIDIDVLQKLLRKHWFYWMLSGLAFGVAIGLLREKEKLLHTLQRLTRVVLAVLTPVLAIALVAFLLSLPFTGLAPLWRTSVSATAMLLIAAAGGVSLVNAVIGDGAEDRNRNRIFFWSAMVLAGCVLPLATLAAVAMALRIGQYGWTPERIWGSIAVVVALIYGASSWWALAKGRFEFDEWLRPVQIRLAQGLCVVALLLALPLIDFGAISARSQLARLASGKISPEKVDWRAMAFDFGPAGRANLERIGKTGVGRQRELAQAALTAKGGGLMTEALNFGLPPTTLTVFPTGAPVPTEVRALLLAGPGIQNPFCSEGGACRVYPQEGGKTFIVFMDHCANLTPAAKNDPDIECSRSPAVFEQKGGKWTNVYESDPNGLLALMESSKKAKDIQESLAHESASLDQGAVRLITVTRRQIEVGGKRSGDVFN